MSTLKQFNYFITIVEQGSFIAASEKLFIAQSALSRQIKLLEEEYNFLLFDRSEKKIQLTPAGNLLYQQLKNHITHIQESIIHAQNIAQGKGRVLRFAYSSSILFDDAKLKMIDHLSQKLSIEFELVNLSSEHQIQALNKGEIDIALIRPPVLQALHEITHFSLYHSRLLVAVHKDNLFFKNQESVAITALKDQLFVSLPHIRRGGLSYLAANLCLSHGFQPKAARIRSRKITQLDLVSHGFGICIVPEEFSTCLPHHVRLLELEQIEITSEVLICCHQQADPIILQCVNEFRQLYSIP